MQTLDSIRIRDARDDERTAIRELTLAAYAEYATIMTASAWAAIEQSLLTALSGDVVAERIVAEQDGRLVGSVMLSPPAADAYGGALARIDWPEVRLLAVAPVARGQGVGTALMHECIRRARQTGATALGLHTSDSLRVAIYMYERMGFVRVPEYDFQPNGAELVKAYRRSLTNAGGNTSGSSL
jgi:GNAT superfamily N-acetyltransferase